VSWFLAIVGFAALVILHEFGHFIAAKATGMRVERFFLFFPPKLFSVKRGETEYGIGAIPLGGFVKITGMNPDEELDPEVRPRAYYSQPVWKRIVVIGAGPAMNVLVAFVLLFFLAFHREQTTNTVDQIEANSPAAQVLHPGDRIIAVDGHRGVGLSQPDKLARFIHLIDQHQCAGSTQTDGCLAKTPAQLRIERDGEAKTVAVKPVYDESLKRHRLGFRYGTEPIPTTIPQAASASVGFMWHVTSQTLSTFAQLFNPEQRKQLSSVVGATEVTQQAFSFSVTFALQLLAVISLSLALINMFPFLPLDGGHIFWALVEKVRGRPVSFRVMERASVVGFMLVLVIFAIGLTNDIHRLSGEGFQLR
jgi:regulator of sigma E protease